MRSGKFLGVLAHEIRNMLGPIRNSVELLKRTPLDADGEKAIETIERQAGRILEMMDDLRSVNPRE